MHKRVVAKLNSYRASERKIQATITRRRPELENSLIFFSSLLPKSTKRRMKNLN